MRDRYGKTHGLSTERVYAIWCGMWTRCTNPNRDGWPDYGGRGITVCDRWRSFENFLQDMGQPPPGHSIDRIDVNGNYEPTNCRWATRAVQARNSRRTRLFTYQGETLPMKDWAARVGMSYWSLRWRLDDGWPIEQALTKPMRRRERVAEEA